MQTDLYCSAESMSRDISKSKNVNDHLGQVNYQLKDRYSEDNIIQSYVHNNGHLFDLRFHVCSVSFNFG